MATENSAVATSPAESSPEAVLDTGRNPQQSTEITAVHEATPRPSPDIVPAAEITPANPNTGVSVDNASKGDRSGGIVIHHLNNSRSQRILWLLEELEVPYSIKKFERNQDQRAPQELKAVHSLGKAPILTDGDVTIAESGAIVAHIISKYGEKFLPTESGKVDDLYFSHYAEGSVMPMIINKYIFSLIPQRSPVFVRPFLKPVFATLSKKLVDPELKAHSDLLESQLEKSKTGWLAGCNYPTSADFMMMFPAEIFAAKSALAGPKTKEYVERIHQRPAYKRGLEKGGQYEYAM